MKSGTHPHVFKRDDPALHKTFPKFGAAAPTVLPLMEYNFDAGFPIPNQNAPDGRFNPALPALPYGCTGETQSRFVTNEDKLLADPQYTYDATCEMEGHAPDQGCDIRNSAKSLTVYGYRRDGDTPAQSLARKRGAFFVIDLVPGRDWFDSFRLAMRGNQKSISIGTPWFREWATVDVTGLLTSLFVYDGNPADYGWHNHLITGEKTVNGEPTLIDYSWQGENYGDAGVVYFDRATFNKAFDIYGTIGVTPGPVVTPAQVQYVEATIYQQILIYLNAILAIIGKQVPNYA